MTTQRVRDAVQSFRRWCRRLFAVTSAFVLLGMVTGDTALAHPSDFDTLTIDLIFGADGLDTIDVAVVESTGSGYDPFPSVE